MRSKAPRHRFQTELDYFDRNVSSWARAGHIGEWVVIKGQSRVGDFYSSDGAAFDQAFEMFGERSFIVQQVCDEQPIYTMRIRI